MLVWQLKKKRAQMAKKKMEKWTKAKQKRLRNGATSSTVLASPARHPTMASFDHHMDGNTSTSCTRLLKKFQNTLSPGRSQAIAEDYNLEMQYHQRFDEIWRSEKDDPILGPLDENMRVRERGRGPLLVSDEEMEAASFFWLAFASTRSKAWVITDLT